MGDTNATGYNGCHNSSRISVADARAVFGHLRSSTTRSYLLRKGALLYNSADSQQPLSGEAKKLNASQLYVDLSEVERVVLSSTTVSVRLAMQSRLEAITNNEH
ncbi:MAG: hypothetical protein AABX69_01405 [Nanoarchaeota archaeon]